MVVIGLVVEASGDTFVIFMADVVLVPSVSSKDSQIIDDLDRAALLLLALETKEEEEAVSGNSGGGSDHTRGLVSNSRNIKKRTSHILTPIPFTLSYELIALGIGAQLGIAVYPQIGQIIALQRGRLRSRARPQRKMATVNYRLEPCRSGPKVSGEVDNRIIHVKTRNEGDTNSATVVTHLRLP